MHHMISLVSVPLGTIHLVIDSLNRLQRSFGDEEGDFNGFAMSVVVTYIHLTRQHQYLTIKNLSSFTGDLTI